MSAPKRLFAGVRRLRPDGAVEAAIPREQWHVCTYPKGTLVFADTTGLHRGGRATRHRRVLGVWAYFPPSSVWPPVYELDRAGIPRALPASTQHALSLS